MFSPTESPISPADTQPEKLTPVVTVALPAEAGEVAPASAASVPEDSLAASVMWLLIFTVAQKGIGFIRSVIVCRWLDPLSLGIWGMSQAFIDTAVPLLLLSIPGIFGRYVEYFRQRGQLQHFLRWSLGVCSCMILAGVGLGLLCRMPLARLVFGDVDYRSWVVGCLFALIPSAMFAFSTELLVGLRRGRAAARGHFFRGLLLTIASLSFLAVWRCDASSMILCARTVLWSRLAAVVAGVGQRSAWDTRRRRTAVHSTDGAQARAGDRGILACRLHLQYVFHGGSIHVNPLESKRCRSSFGVRRQL